MREIKFRAWWQDDKYMPHGKMYMVAGFHNIVEHDYNEPERDISDKPQEVFIVEQLPTVEKVNWNDAKNMKLMQYTGLKDNNDKEIYEGDIVTVDGDQKGPVEYDAVSFVVPGYYLSRQDNPADAFSGEASIEVIGNIYENPELLK